MENKVENKDPFIALKGLSLLGKKTRECKIGDVVITLSTLSAKEESAIFVASSDFSGTAYFHQVKRETLKQSIKAIDGQQLYDFEKYEKEAEPGTIDTEKFRTETQKKVLESLNDWDDTLITHLYTEWAALSKESEEELKKMGIKSILAYEAKDILKQSMEELAKEEAEAEKSEQAPDKSEKSEA